MSIILDRLTVRVHYGSEKVAEIKSLASPALNRLIAAKRIAERAGLLEHTAPSLHSLRANLATIKKIEKHLKFLEDRGALNVDDTGTVFFSTEPVDLGALGRGVIDIDFTALGMIMSARRSVSDFCPAMHYKKGFSASFTDIFKERSGLSPEGTYYSRFQKLVRRNLRHPILFLFTARELAASHALFDANIFAARRARWDWIKRFPGMQDRIRQVEDKIQEAKSTPQPMVDQLLYSDAEPTADKRFVVVASDLHLGSKGFADEKEFLRFCLMVKKLGARMIMNGDTFDMAEYGFNLPSAIKNNHALLRAIYQNGGRLIKGNHDDRLTAFSLASPDRQRAEFHPVDNIMEHGVYIEHMHQAGKMFEHSWWKILYWPISFLEKVFGHKFLKWAELLQRELFNLGNFFANLFRRPGDKIDLWEKTKVQSIINRLKAVHRERDNLIYIGGHEHFAGVSATLKKVIKGVRADEELGGGKLKFYCSGGWKGREGYAGDFLVVDLTEEKEAKVYPFVWEYTHDPVIVFKKAAS